MRFHPAGKTILITSAVAFLMILFLAALLADRIVFILLATASTLQLILVFRFFRLPSRQVQPSEIKVLAPADGKIVAIEKTTENEYFGRAMVQVSIFMSIHNVHKNWYPLKGEIMYVKYHPGKYLLARHPKSSLLNERTSVVIAAGENEIMVRQIAGYVARRILCHATIGNKVSQEDELGFIRFGSRLDILLPLDATILLSVGARTTGGITPLATLK